MGSHRPVTGGDGSGHRLVRVHLALEPVGCALARRRAAEGRRAGGAAVTRPRRHTKSRFGGMASALALMLMSSVLSAQGPSAASPVPTDDEIRRIIAERVDKHRQSIGIVVGVIEPAGRRIIAYGTRARGDAGPLDGDTVFEIGSITKVFTSLLLADAAQRGELALTDPVAKYLPATVKVPERGRAITLQDLATHTSGLPRLPTNFQPKDGTNPYADYSVEQMYAFLSGHELAREVGALYDYSNFGAGLLGHALSRRAGLDYEALVRARITNPLGMKSTSIALSP